MPPWLLGIRSRVPPAASFALGLIPVLALLLAWWFVTRGEPEDRMVEVTILPSPAEVLASVPELLTRHVPDSEDPEVQHNFLLQNVGLSLKRVGLAFLLAFVVVFPLGILVGALGSVRALFTPLTTASGYIPIATLIPLTLSWFGTQEFQKIFFLAMAFGIYLLPLVVQAIDAVPDVYLRTSYTLGASRWQAIRHVLVPVALPEIWHSMRLAFGVGWTYLVLAEVVVANGGLGHVINMAERRGPREHIYVAILIITLIAWAADLAWERLGRLLFPYKRSRS